jgi:LysM repeat protein
VHLTRRGRALAILVFAAVLLGAFSLGRTASQAAAPSAPAASASVDEATSVHQATVQPGDSLWSVARRVAPDNDPREVVEQIRRLNDLPSANIQVGQQLLLPVAA